MQRRGLLIIVALIIVVGGIAVAFLLGQPPAGDPNATQVTDGGGGTGGGGNTQVDLPPTFTPIPMVEIVVAVQQLPRGFTIPPNAVELRPWPQYAAPVGALTSVEDVIGKIARTDIFREQPILQNMVVESLSDLANVGSDLAAVLPPNRVAIAIPIDRITSVAYAIQPGDRVDVIMSMLFVDVDDTFQTIAPNCFTLFVISADGIQTSDTICGRPDTTILGPAIIGPSETQRPRLVTQRTVEDAQVMYLGNFPNDGRFLGLAPTPTTDPNAQGDTGDSADTTTDDGGRRQATAVPTPDIRPDIITVAVSPQDAVVLTWAVEAKLPITFALRSAQSTSGAPTTAVTLDYIMDRFAITLPTKRGYALEPAIRSIRQLFAGKEISLAAATPSATPTP